MSYRLVKTDEGRTFTKDIEVLDRDSLGGLGERTLEVLEAVGQQRTYPKKIAESLGIHEQKVYYHIKKLKDAGLIEVVKKERKGSALCKFYRPKADALGFQVTEGWKKSREPDTKVPDEAFEFFSEFVGGDSFKGSIVVGSPVEHGPFMTASRDGHYAIQLGLFLGGFCSLENRFAVKLDTEVKAEKALDRNLILIGGPITNTVSRDLNEVLEVRFDWENRWKIYSGRTGKSYSEENVGLIAKVEDRNYKRILLSGLDFRGTKTCILAATQQPEKIFDDYVSDKQFYRVIKGLDRDGDGKTDDVEILE